MCYNWCMEDIMSILNGISTVLLIIAIIGFIVSWNDVESVVHTVSLVCVMISASISIYIGKKQKKTTAE